VLTELPLTRANRILLARSFKNVPRVDMSIDCVIEGQMGRALADDGERPTAFKIEVGPFFYCAGDARGAGGQALIASTVPYTLFMPSAPGWIETAKQTFGERLIGFERYSFSAERVSAEQLQRLCRESVLNDDVRRMDEAFAARCWGQDHLVDLSAYESAADFVERGIGFYIERHGSIAGVAYASLVCSRGIEVSIFVAEEQRRQGIATLLASRLLLWCDEHHAEANWDAANPESCRLAEKLGYVPKGSYRAHYLQPE
jgi:RimJ/RimL family protein N-acetyltransferase